MTATSAYVSAYHHRLNLIRDVLSSHSKLTEKDASELAERVLDAMNHIPEKVR